MEELRFAVMFVLPLTPPLVSKAVMATLEPTCLRYAESLAVGATPFEAVAIAIQLLLEFGVSVTVNDVAPFVVAVLETNVPPD